MSNTSDNDGGRHSPPPPRPAVFDSKPVQLEKTRQRMGSARTLRRALMSAADEVGGEEGLKGYLKFLATGSASDRAAFVSLLSKLLPRAVAVAQADVNTGVNVVLPWLQEQRGVDATPPGDGVVIDQQTIENINENDV